MNHDVVVVGAGVFGATIARALFLDGHSVVLLDDRRPLSGSAPSAFLMKPSWFSGLGKAAHEPALAMLHAVYPVRSEEFVVGAFGLKLKRQSCYRIDAARVLADGGPNGELQVTKRSVLDVQAGLSTTWPHVKLQPIVGMTGVERLEARNVIVAAGVWCSVLLNVPSLYGKRGVSFTYDGQLEDNLIRPFAPYRQIVAFNSSPTTVWAGDGTAIKDDNWTIKHQETAEERLTKALGFRGARPRACVGIRPFAELGGKPCLLEQRGKGLWLATGGGKNGTIAAGWAAHQLREMLK